VDVAGRLAEHHLCFLADRLDGFLAVGTGFLANRDDLLALRQGNGKSLFTFYRTLIRLRLKNPGLKSRHLETVYTHNRNRLLAFRRWDDGQQFLVVASLNNHAFDQPSYCFDTPLIPPGNWAEALNSDSLYFGGNNVGNGGRQIGIGQHGFECVVPANGVLVLKRV
jgi:1,4-alpha-glucan branching enzyme